MLVGGIAPHASNGLNAWFQISSVDMAFPCPASRKLQPFIVPIRQVQREAHGAFQLYWSFPLVAEADAAGENAALTENGVEKLCTDAGGLILQRQD